MEAIGVSAQAAAQAAEAATEAAAKLRAVESHAEASAVQQQATAAELELLRIAQTEQKRQRGVLDQLRNGDTLALVSDAGTPG